MLEATSDITISASQIYKVALGLFTAASSTWALCNQPPAIIKKHVNFPEVRRLSVVLITVFIALIVGGFGHPQEQLLEWIAITATVTGTTLFFIVLHQSKKFKPSAIPVWILLLFFLYTCAISCGVTSASVYVLLKSSGRPASDSQGSVTREVK